MTYAPGSNIGNLHWVWHCTSTSIDEALKTSQLIIEKIKKDIPQFHTRAIQREAFQLFGLATPPTKRSFLRHLHKELVGDSSASANLGQSEINERVATIFELEEPSIVYDLRNHYGQKTNFDLFWSDAKEFIKKEVGVADDDHRHSNVVHCAKAISVCDLKEKVVERCP